MNTWSDYSFSKWSGADRDHEPEPRADGHRPGGYVPEVSVPPFDDDPRRSTRRGCPSRSPGHDRGGLPPQPSRQPERLGLLGSLAALSLPLLDLNGELTTGRAWWIRNRHTHLRPVGSRAGGEVTRQPSPDQVRRRRERDRVNHARAGAPAAGQDPGEITSPQPPLRRVVLPVSRAPRTGWKDRAACPSSPPEWFDAETDEAAARALAVCAGCQVRGECFLAAAADRGSPESGAGRTCPRRTGRRVRRSRHDRIPRRLLGRDSCTR